MNMNMENENSYIKRKLRNHMIEVRRAIPENERTEQSIRASLAAEGEVLSALRSLRGGRLNIFSYVSFRDEADTRYLIRNALTAGDHVLVPKVNENDTISVHEIKSESELVPGSWGIPEPGEHTVIWPSSRWTEIDLVMVPGLAFDRRGGRIGYGGGYYDRFISEWKLKHGTTGDTVFAALAYTEQLLPDGRYVPMEEHDLMLDLIFTSSGTIYTRK